MTQAPASYEEARSAIMALLQTGYRKPPTTEQTLASQQGDPWMPIEYENRTITPPRETLWGRASLQWGDGSSASIGTGHRRSIAIFYLQIFAPENTGMKETNLAVDRLAILLDNREMQTEHCDIRFDTVSRQTVGPQESWYQCNALVRVTVDAHP